MSSTCFFFSVCFPNSFFIPFSYYFKSVKGVCFSFFFVCTPSLDTVIFFLQTPLRLVDVLAAGWGQRAACTLGCLSAPRRAFSYLLCLGPPPLNSPRPAAGAPTLSINDRPCTCDFLFCCLFCCVCVRVLLHGCRSDLDVEGNCKPRIRVTRCGPQLGWLRNWGG